MSCDSPPLEPVQVSLDLPCDLSSAGAARRRVVRECRSAGAGDDALERLELLTSEVVTNAVLHGRSDVRLRLVVPSGPPRRVRVEVGDDNSRRPAAQLADAGALDGRGLTILEALSLAWGVDDAPVGKVVWFEVEA